MLLGEFVQGLRICVDPSTFLLLIRGGARVLGLLIAWLRQEDDQADPRQAAEEDREGR